MLFNVRVCEVASDAYSVVRENNLLTLKSIVHFKNRTKLFLNQISVEHLNVERVHDYSRVSSAKQPSHFSDVFELQTFELADLPLDSCFHDVDCTAVLLDAFIL